MSQKGPSIRRWLEEFTGDLHMPNRWRLYARLEESPKTFPLMVLCFLDEFSSCFRMNVEYDVDVLSIDFDRQIDLEDLLRVAEFLHQAWVDCQHISVMKSFQGSLVDSLRTATLEFIEDGGAEWIFYDGVLSDVEVRGNCGEKIEQLRWDL